MNTNHYQNPADTARRAAQAVSYSPRVIVDPAFTVSRVYMVSTCGT